MSLYDKKRKFERACKWGSDSEIRETAESLYKTSFFPADRRENVEFIAKTLKKEKGFETRSFGSETTYDGITVNTGCVPKLEIDEPYDQESEY